MTYKQQLIDLLKSDEETKTAMEKLELGCILKFGIETCSIISKFNSYNVLFHTDGLIGFIEEEEFKKYEIIGLPLQERFIRMYCENNGIYICITTSGFICGINIDKPYSKLDNNLDFDNQSEEVYKQIFLALTNLTNNEE